MPTPGSHDPSTFQESEEISVCHLRCPGCVTGSGSPRKLMQSLCSRAHGYSVMHHARHSAKSFSCTVSFISHNVQKYMSCCLNFMNDQIDPERFRNVRKSHGAEHQIQIYSTIQESNIIGASNLWPNKEIGSKMNTLNFISFSVYQFRSSKKQILRWNTTCNKFIGGKNACRKPIGRKQEEAVKVVRPPFNTFSTFPEL